MACFSGEGGGKRRKLDAREDVAESNPLLVELLLTKQVNEDVKADQQPLSSKEVAIDIKQDHPLVLVKKVDADVQRLDRQSCRIANQKSLKAAIISGNVSALLFLLNNGVDVREKIDDMKTALHFAKSGCMVEILWERGADINATDNEGYTPLQSALLRDKAEVVEALLIFGARVDLKHFEIEQRWSEDGPCFRPRFGRRFCPPFDSLDDVEFFVLQRMLIGDISIGVPKQSLFAYLCNSYLISFSLANKIKELMIKFKQAGYRSDTTDLMIGKNCDTSDDFARQCSQQVEQMKKVRFGQISLYDVLSKGLTECSFAANVEICKTIENDQCKQDFPLYHSLLRTHLRIAKRRRAFLREAVKKFEKLVAARQNVNLPEEICHVILSELSTAELIRFNRALSYAFVV